MTETPPLNAGAPGPMPRQGTRFHMLQLRPGANKSILKKKQNKLCTYVVLMTYIIKMYICSFNDNSLGFPGAQMVKKSTCSTGDLGSVPGLGRSPGRGHGNPLQYSCLENPMDRGAWWATVHGVTKSQTQLSD